ncbi:PTS sugar transporter subunit IIA [Thermoanaerobacterium thermosaccharolyticum]|uniref:Phosphotransferase system, mannose/fructose-specific component IIA n=1 Tax=Thermoanaerobacterium thermosaccharolyticum M0795 TaxID=698948 RepID=L0IKK3_THETR|nr:PTS sugar transporter subunit IIA [Thermoanaerobacterium thermosaccharolyticum]AGB19363.1 phosphotransferase system, mannose/fructose-specific component IIA [Thermoanaerobacterium thermosaccharolyticum M0795]
MIGILVVTHGDFGRELIKSAELIVGKQDNIKCIGLFHGDDIEKFKREVSNTIYSLDDGDGVLVFTDLFGASPSNVVALSMKPVSKEVNFECITGVNMPMILEALTMRKSCKLKGLKEHSLNVGLGGIKDLYNELNMNKENDI